MTKTERCWISTEFWIPAAQCVIRRILSDYKIPVTDIHTEKALNSIGIIQNHVLPDGSFAWKTFLDMAIDMKPALEAMHCASTVDTRDLEGKLTRYFDEESFAENKSIKGIGDLPAICSRCMKRAFISALQPRIPARPRSNV